MQKSLPLFLFFLLALAAVLPAQVTRQVAFADVQENSLDQIIDADLEAADGDSVYIYELQRGVPFIFSGTVRYDSTFHVIVRAQEGDGAMPILLMSVTDGETPSELFRLNGLAELTVEGLLLSGESDQGTFTARTIRADGANRITVRDCYFDQTRQSIFRLSGGDEKLFVYNSRFNRIGQPDNPNNGRFIDHRGAGADSVVVEGCQVTNVTSRFWRTGSDAKPEYVRMENNTFVTSGQNGFNYAEIDELIFRNNIVVNVRLRGDDLDDNIDSNEASYGFTIDTFIEGEDIIVFEYNNFFDTQQLIESFPDTAFDGDTLARTGQFERYYDLQIQRAIGEDDTNFSEQLEFGNAPLLSMEQIASIAQDTSGGNPEVSFPWDLSNLTPFADYSGNNLGSVEPIARYVEYYDLCYGDDARSATASATGNSLGGVIESCEGLTGLAENLADRWQFVAFPNPTNGWVDLRLEGNTEEMIATVFSATGALVWRNSFFTERTRLDLSAQPAGTYFVRLQNRSGASAIRTIIKQ